MFEQTPQPDIAEENLRLKQENDELIKRYNALANAYKKLKVSYEQLLAQHDAAPIRSGVTQEAYNEVLELNKQLTEMVAELATDNSILLDVMHPTIKNELRARAAVAELEEEIERLDAVIAEKEILVEGV